MAGCHVRDGAVNRASLVRALRDDQVLADTRVESLRRFTDDVRDVQAGAEGELVGEAPATFRIIPGALNLRV